MAYQPKPMLPADLRAYRAPTFWRLHGEKVYAGVFAALVLFAAFKTTGAWQVSSRLQMPGVNGFAPGKRPTFASTINAAGTTSPVASSAGPAAPFDCPRLRGTLWLRAMVCQQGDRTIAGCECIYHSAPSERFVQ